jgi:hypothetical protein
MQRPNAALSPTGSYGLRYDYVTLLKEQYGRMSSVAFDRPNPVAANRLGTVIYEAVCNCSFNHNYPWALGPRLGAAYQINSKTVFRAGGGISYSKTSNDASKASNFKGNSGEDFRRRATVTSNLLHFSALSRVTELCRPVVGQSARKSAAAQVRHRNRKIYSRVNKFAQNLHILKMVVEAEKECLDSCFKQMRFFMLLCPRARVRYVAECFFALQQYVHKCMAALMQQFMV